MQNGSQSQEDGSLRLDNPKHEAFAQSYARGRSLAASYRDAGYEDDRRNAWSFFTTNHDVRARVEWLRRDAAAAAKLTLEKAIEILEAIIATPIADVDAEHFLAMSYKAVTGEIKLPSKMDAMVLLGKWRGWEKGTAAEQTIAGALAHQLSVIRTKKSAPKKPDAAPH